MRKVGDHGQHLGFESRLEHRREAFIEFDVGDSALRVRLLHDVVVSITIVVGDPDLGEVVHVATIVSAVRRTAWRGRNW